MKVKGIKKAVGQFNRSVIGVIHYDVVNEKCFYAPFANVESGVLQIVNSGMREKVTMSEVEQAIEEEIERYEHKRLMIELRGGLAK